MIRGGRHACVSQQLLHWHVSVPVRSAGCCPWTFTQGQARELGGGVRGASHPRRRYLSVREGVVVRPHLRVHVVQVPLEAAALQPLAQGQTLGHVPEVHTRVLQGRKRGRAGAGVCGAPTTQATTQGRGAPQAPRASPPSGFLVWEPPVLPGPCKVQGSRADGKDLASLASLQQVPPETGLAFSRPLAVCVGLACLSCPVHSPGR